MKFSYFWPRKQAVPRQAPLLYYAAICMIHTFTIQTSAFSPPSHSSHPTRPSRPTVHNAGHISSLSYLQTNPHGPQTCSSLICTSNRSRRMKNGYRSVATFMSTASEGKRPSDVIPLLKYLRMFRTGTSLGRSNRTGNTRRLGTAIEQTEGQEEEQIGSTALEETASRETDAGVSSAGAAKRGWFSVKGAFGALKRLRRVVEVPENAADEGKFLLMAAFVGVLTGTSVTLFKLLIGAVKGLTYVDLIERFSANSSAIVGAFIPVMGAIAVVSLMRILRLKSYGPGLGGLTEEVDKQVPWSPTRTVGKTLAAVATLGTGNSLGPEGPAVELGVAASRCVSSVSNLSVERQRMLLGAGAAGGVAAGFNAPIAGIFFALEIVKDTFSTSFNSKSFIAGTLLCAVVSALIAKIGLHDELSLRPAAYNLESPLIELPLYLGLGIVAGLVAVMFKFFSRKSADLFAGNFSGFKWMKEVPQWAKPIMMAAVTGLVGAAYPQVLFFGYETLDNLLANTGQYSIRGLCMLCVSKSLLTAGALGSGLVGGTFAPSLFLGATAGAAYQRILLGFLTTLRSTAGNSIEHLSTLLLPVTSMFGIGGPTGDLSSMLNIAGSPAYAMVGAAAVLSALYRAPLTGSLLLFELTKDYDIVLPLMAAAGVSSLVVELFSRVEDESSAKETSAAMPRDMSLEIGLKMSSESRIGGVQLTDALVPRILTLTADTSLQDAMRAFRLSRSEFAVVVQQSAGSSADDPGKDTSSSASISAQSMQGESWGTQTLWAEDLWERQDLQLVGVLALREIVLALEKEKYNARFGEVEKAIGLTAGGVCRKNCFTVQTSADIKFAQNIMGSKGVRFLPVVKGVESLAGDKPAPVVVGVLSRESLRIAGRLMETEQAVRDVSASDAAAIEAPPATDFSATTTAAAAAAAAAAAGANQ